MPWHPTAEYETRIDPNTGLLYKSRDDAIAHAVFWDNLVLLSGPKKSIRSIASDVRKQRRKERKKG